MLSNFTIIVYCVTATAFIIVGCTALKQPETSNLTGECSTTPANIGPPPDGSFCEPECYCIPDTEPCAVCPSLEDRMILGTKNSFQSMEFFRQLLVEKEDTLYTFDPPGCQPFPLVAQVLFGGIVPICSGVTPQNDSVHNNQEENNNKAMNNKQCSFQYVNNVCETNQYNLIEQDIFGGIKSKINLNRHLKYEKRISKSSKKTKNSRAPSTASPSKSPPITPPSSTQVTSSPTFRPTSPPSTASPTEAPYSIGTYVTHDGPCGVCSSAQDLAVYLSPTLDQDAFVCTSAARGVLASQNPTLIQQAVVDLVFCHVELGFTHGCAQIWSYNSLNTLLALGAASVSGGNDPSIPQTCTDCAQQCLVDAGTPECTSPLKPFTCELSSCFECDELVSGPIFAKYAGRTRRRSGINTVFNSPENMGIFVGTKRPCSAVPNIGQPRPECSSTNSNGDD